MGYSDEFEYDDDEEYYEDEDEEYLDYDDDDDDSKDSPSSPRGSIGSSPVGGARPGGGLPGAGSSSRFGSGPGGGLGAGRPGGGSPSRIGGRSSDDEENDDEDESLSSTSRFGGAVPGRIGAGASSFGVRPPASSADDEDLDEDEDESISKGSRPGAVPPAGGSRFGAPTPPAGGSRFGTPPGGTTFLRPAGGDDKKDDSSPAGGSRFGSSPSSPTPGGSRFGVNPPGGGSSPSSPTPGGSRFGSNPPGGGSSPSSPTPGGSRFGSNPPGGAGSSPSSPTPGGSRFGSNPPAGGGSSPGGAGSSPAGGSRFGSTPPAGGAQTADKKDDKPSGGGFGSRFGGGGDKKDDKKDEKPASGGFGSRFGGGSEKKDDKKDEKPAGGGLLGGIGSRLGGGAQSADKKDEKPTGGGLLGGIGSRFGGGSEKKDDKKDEKPASGGLLGGIGSRFGGGSEKKDDKALAAKDQKAESGSRFGGMRFGNAPGSDKKEEAAKPPFGAKGANTPPKEASASGGKFSAAGTNAKGTEGKDKEQKGGSMFGSLGGFGRGKSEDKSAPADSKKTGKANAAKAGESGGNIFGRMSAGIGGLFGRGKAEEKPRQRQTKAASSKVPVRADEDGLTLDNWLDIIGVGLVFGSLVLFFSAISAEQAAIAAVHRFIGQLFGWGALAVPVTMFLIGMWLIIRHFGETAPAVDPVRVVGVAVLFVALLVLFQYIDSFSYDNIILSDGATTQALLQARLDYSWSELQTGGGIIGARLYYLLVVNVTEAGAVLLVLFLGFVGGMFVTRQSAAELVRGGTGMWRSFREWTQMRAMERRVQRQRARLAAEERMAMQAQAAAAMPVTVMTQPEPAAPVRQQTAPDSREIRFSLGGQISTLKQGQEQAAQPVQTTLPIQPVATVAPAQPAATEQRGGVLSGLRNVPFGLGSRGNRGSDAGAVPPPLVTPLPMDDPVVPVQQPAASLPAVPVQQPLISTPASFTSQPAAPAQAEAPVSTPIQQPMMFGASAEPITPPAATVAAPDGAADDLDAVTKARQDRLNALRRGEMGPLSTSTLQSARREEAEKAAFVPSSEGQRERSFNQIVASAESIIPQPQPTEPGEEAHKITPPSQLPSAQSSQEVFQRSLSQPISSEVKNQSRQKVQWRLPDFRTLLSSGSEQELDKEFLLKQAKIIENTLREFGAPGRVVEINTGPVITQFGVEPDYQMGRGGKKQRVKVSAIAALDKDLQLALGARSIRVEAPVPGKGYVGIEVPNAESTLVSLRDVMDSPGFNKYKSPLAIALGQSVSGAPISADLSAMPHLLIAGTTGSGKSVCVNSIIASVISRNTPDVVKFIMVDPKRVELTGYNGIPHLVAPVVVELERIVGVLKWVTREMDERYRRFSDAGARNIEDYNKHRDPLTDPMPYIIVIIDELADLMMLAPEETERTITRIAALARATGIHLVIATQRPSVDVVTGLIKANFPARIAFAVAGSVDSRVILDQPGAERLLGKGDMLYLSGDSPAPLRLQGVYVSDMEINNIVRYWKLQAVQQPESSGSLSLAPRFASSETPKDARPRTDKARQAGFWDSGESLPSFATGKNRSSAPVLEDEDDYDEDEDFEDDDFDEELSDEELSGDAGSGHEDELYEKSVELVRRLDKASISLLQRRLRIGYTRAARLIDVMEARGVVGPAKEGSSKPRDVLPG